MMLVKNITKNKSILLHKRNIRLLLGGRWKYVKSRSGPKNANSIYNRYIKSYYDVVPSWIIFSEGKALVKKGHIKEGISKFKKISLTNYSLFEFTKAQLKILQSFIKYL